PDKVSVSANFIHTVVLPYNYSPGGFSLAGNYKFWKNFSVGLYNALAFSKDIRNRNGFYTSRDIFLNTMGTVGYQYYIYKNKLAFGLYGMAGMYYRRISSHVTDRNNNIDREYHADHADRCLGAALDVHFAMSTHLAVN